MDNDSAFTETKTNNDDYIPSVSVEYFPRTYSRIVAAFLTF